MSELGFPVDVEKSEISSALNSFILEAFGLGLYTVIYIGTIYIYFTRSSSKRYFVPTAITVLFLCNIVQTGIEWFVTKWQYVDNGDTRDSVFVSLFGGPTWVYLASSISSYIGFVLADGLLIWRCFFVWNQSLRIILAPLLLIFTEIALFFLQIVIYAKFGAAVPASLLPRINDSLSAAYFTTFSTSLLTTALIAYRIYSVTKQDGVSARRFKHVVDIVVQSGMVYSLALLVTAIDGVSPGTGDAFSTENVAFTFYTSALAGVIAGMSATILVARVSMLAPDTTYPSTSIHLSGLQFDAHSTHHTAPPQGVESAHSIVDRNLAAEVQRVEGKVEKGES